MRKNYIVFAIATLLAFCINSSFAQNNEKPWFLGLEFHAIDLYPVGEDAPQGEYFDEFFNLTDHWNIGIPKLTVYKYLNKNTSISLGGSYNLLKKLNQLGPPTGIDPDDLTYIAVDGMFNYNFNGLGYYKKLRPFVSVGGGYTWIEEGLFDSSKIQGSNLIGAGTINGAVGAKYWIDDGFAINLQTTYKHAFKDYLSKHWQHSIGIEFRLAHKKEEPVKEVKDRDGDGVPDDNDVCPDEPGLAELNGCPDGDGDGVADKDDKCPTVFGLKQYEGCPDTDGDGFPDNIDKCPEVKGTDSGCPEVVKVPEPVVSEKKVYFAFDKFNIDGEAQAVLDEILSLVENANYTISVEGHGDHLGTVDYNHKLSIKRAEAVKAYLVSKGLSETSISTSGAGETNPIASNETESGRALNRRAELIIKVVSQ